MLDEAWQLAHLDDLARRLSWLVGQPDGVLLDATSPQHHIRIVKQSGQVQLFFVDPATGALDGPMSRIALGRPLQLLAEYTQAAMLALLWHPEPRRACLLGLAGGRLSLVLYHHFPDLAIDNVDIDPDVAGIAETYFGVAFDTRQTFAAQDARAFVRACAPGPVYDLIVMDAFQAGADVLPHLATAEFYDECRERLVPGGGVCANILRSDPLFREKAKTFLHGFRHTYVSEYKHGLVLIGNDRTRLSHPDIVRRAVAIQRRRRFDFPFVERAARLCLAREVARLGGHALRDVCVLRDEALVTG